MTLNCPAQLAGDVEYTDCIFVAGKDTPTTKVCPGYDTKLYLSLL